jgi:transposase-like protein
MERRFTSVEKMAILAELDSVKWGGKQAVLDHHGVSSQAVSKWRKALREGSLGKKRGRARSADLEAAIDRLDGVPRALKEMRRVDPDLAADDRVPTPERAEREILDEIVDRVDNEELPWNGEMSPDWVERLEANIKVRVSRKRRDERERPGARGPVDWLGEVATNRPDQLCRRGDCPCAMLCRVPHFHAPAMEPTSDSEETGAKQTDLGEKTGDMERLRSVGIVCVNPDCAINRFCLPRDLPPSPLHVLVQREAPLPAGNWKPVEEWTSPEDCPWNGTCDVRHERTDPADLEIANAVQATWQLVRLWCVDPGCRLHRRGSPHVHCVECGEPFPAMYRNRELDVTTMARDHLAETNGLCERCYSEWKKRLLDENGP